MAQQKARNYFGNVRKLPSGRFQARWKVGSRYLSAKTPDGRALTFTTERKARLWLADHREAILSGDWSPAPAAETPGEVTVGEYASAWISSRPLADRTRDHYRQLLRDHIVPTFGHRAISSVQPPEVRTWHAGLKTGPTAKAHTYSLFKAVMATAMDDDIITANPCRVRSAGQAPTAKKMRPATLDELEALTEAMPERLRMLVQLAVWCSLRFGEVAEIRRSDVDLDARLIHVSRAVVRTEAGVVRKAPKSKAGIRSVTIPPHIVEGLRAHLADHVEAEGDALLFPAAHGGNLAPATLYRSFYAAREAAGRPDLRFHDLRHTGQTLAARAGADLRELMNRAGQSSSAAALRYIHEVNGRQTEIADAMSALLKR